MLDETRNAINKKFLSILGMNYDSFEKLDYDLQQKIINDLNKKKYKLKKRNSIVMIGSGQHATFIKVRNGKRVMIDNGVVIEAGLSLEKAQQRLEDSFDEVVYSKPIYFAKKLVRRIKK